MRTTFSGTRLLIVRARTSSSRSRAQLTKAAANAARRRCRRNAVWNPDHSGPGPKSCGHSAGTRQSAQTLRVFTRPRRACTILTTFIAEVPAARCRRSCGGSQVSQHERAKPSADTRCSSKQQQHKNCCVVAHSFYAICISCSCSLWCVWGCWSECEQAECNVENATNKPTNKNCCTHVRVYARIHFRVAANSRRAHTQKPT